MYVYVYMSVLICVCIHACMKCTHHACMFACTHGQMYVCMYVWMHACMHACLHACIYMDVFMYLCMFKCFYLLYTRETTTTLYSYTLDSCEMHIRPPFQQRVLRHHPKPYTTSFTRNPKPLSHYGIGFGAHAEGFVKFLCNRVAKHGMESFASEALVINPSIHRSICLSTYTPTLPPVPICICTCRYMYMCVF